MGRRKGQQKKGIEQWKGGKGNTRKGNRRDQILKEKEIYEERMEGKGRKKRKAEHLQEKENKRRMKKYNKEKPKN